VGKEKHTPLPWMFNKQGPPHFGWQVVSSTGDRLVALVEPKFYDHYNADDAEETKANAELIVRACNGLSTNLRQAMWGFTDGLARCAICGAQYKPTPSDGMMLHMMEHIFFAIEKIS
jgi:hypothetical protein